MIDLLRKEKRNGDIEQLAIEPFQNDRPGVELNEVLHEALEKLPQIQKSVIMLRDYEGYSYEEIGEICKLNESQVKVYIFRARKALKDYIVKMELVV
jgi:RNA polymerase sigma-70 factor (ECF subfamily)